MSRVLVTLAAAFLLFSGSARSETAGEATLPAPSPELLAPRSRTPAQPSMHPPIRLLDDKGESVLRTGRPVAPASCGSATGCHDVGWIAKHDLHAATRATASCATLAALRSHIAMAKCWVRRARVQRRRFCPNQPARFWAAHRSRMRRVPRRSARRGRACIERSVRTGSAHLRSHRLVFRLSA